MSERNDLFHAKTNYTLIWKICTQNILAFYFFSVFIVGVLCVTLENIFNSETKMHYQKIEREREKR